MRHVLSAGSLLGEKIAVLSRYLGCNRRLVSMLLRLRGDLWASESRWYVRIGGGWCRLRHPSMRLLSLARRLLLLLLRSLSIKRNLEEIQSKGAAALTRQTPMC